MSDVQQSAARALRGAERARDELRAALRSAGIVLPSLGVEPMAYGDEKPRPLVELGRCTVPTAHKLTAALRNSVSVSTAEPFSGADTNAA